MDIDLSVILSLVAIVVSVSISILTLLLTEFRGPSISLLNKPRFILSDEILLEKTRTYIDNCYTLSSLELERVFFVFANHGGKSGTILDLSFEFVPHPAFQPFIEKAYFDFDISETGKLSIPLTIREGDNKTLVVSPRFHLVNWKKMALAEILEPSLKIDEMILKSAENSKEKFKQFCDVLANTRELGNVSCTATLTKGRFKTRVKTEKLGEFQVINQSKNSFGFLMEALDRWEDLRPTKSELLNELTRHIKAITKELKKNKIALQNEVREANIGKSRLRNEAWNQFQKERPPYKEKLQWFLIKSEKGLEQNLRQLYKNISKYNALVDQTISLGEFRRRKHFLSLNSEREKLYTEVDEVVYRLNRILQKIAV